MLRFFMPCLLTLVASTACRSTQNREENDLKSLSSLREQSFDNFPESPYKFLQVDHAEIDKHLVRGSKETNTPPALQGIFWLDSDKMADVAITFANVKFRETRDKKTNAIVHEGYLAVFDEGIWSWDDSKKGFQAYWGVGFSKLYYHLRFNEDFSLGVITPNFKPLPKLPRVEIDPSFFVKVTMKRFDENEYTRETVILGTKSTYRFRRIVDGEGNRLPVYDEYLAALQRRGLTKGRIPKCPDHTGTSLPTSCAYPPPAED